MSSNDDEAKPAAPAMMKFRKSGGRKARMPSAMARRQGEIATLAFTHLHDKTAAMAFLNEYNDGLGGRPLELAMASDDGFATVSAAITDMAE